MSVTTFQGIGIGIGILGSEFVLKGAVSRDSGFEVRVSSFGIET